MTLTQFNTLANNLTPAETVILSYGDGFLTLTQMNGVQPNHSQAYPFLGLFPDWRIHSYPLQDAPDAEASLRLVRENKIVDICAYAADGTLIDTSRFLATLGLDIAMTNGPAVVSKRLARLFSPYRYGHFFQPDEVEIVYDPARDPAVWDGIGWVSRTFIERHADVLLAHLSGRAYAAHRRELAKTGRFEVTLMTAEGQLKGDVLVCDSLTDENADFVFAPGSVKGDVRLTSGWLFVGLAQPRHARTRMKLDVQSLINHVHFFGVPRLLDWLADDNQRFIDNITSGRTQSALGSLIDLDAPAAVEQLESWWLLNYFASGGEALWFGGVIQSLARQRTKQLALQVNQKHRFPVPGGRFYIAPASAGERTVLPGQVALDYRSATAFVNDDDWRAFIVERLGGCDGDDAVWCVPFTMRMAGAYLDDDAGEDTEATDADGQAAGDACPEHPGTADDEPVTGLQAGCGHAVDDDRDAASQLATDADPNRRLLIWRSPNQPGEWVVLMPTPDSFAPDHWAWPELDVADLVNDDADIVYGTLAPVAQTDATLPVAAPAHLIAPPNAYSVAQMDDAIARAQANRGALGTYVNVLMVCQAVFGRAPRQLPARLEQVIDAMVKTGQDLSAVKAWCQTAADQLARRQVAVPTALVKRLKGLTQRPLATTSDHWFDQLIQGANAEMARFQQQMDALTLRCCPPALLFEHGAPWLPVAEGIYTDYYRALASRSGRPDFRGAYRATDAALAEWSDAGLAEGAFAGLVALLYSGGLASATADNILFQAAPHADGQPDVVTRFVSALRQLGVLTDPRDPWTWLAEQQTAKRTLPQVVPVQFNGVWFSYLRVQQPQTPPKMGLVPPETVRWAKRRVAQLPLVNQVLGVEVRGDRLVALTAQGNVFGYVQRGQEPVLDSVRQVRIRQARPDRNGNILAVVEPVI